MPQLDPTFFATQLFWLVVTFVVLYIVLSSTALPRIGNVLEERQRKIDDNLDKAAELKGKADAAIAAYEKALADSRAQAQRTLREGADVLSKQAEQRQRELGERLSAQIKDGEKRIIQAKQQAMEHVREVAAEVAKLATAKLTGLAPEDAQVTSALDATLREVR